MVIDSIGNVEQLLDQYFKALKISQLSFGDIPVHVRQDNSTYIP